MFLSLDPTGRTQSPEAALRALRGPVPGTPEGPLSPAFTTAVQLPGAYLCQPDSANALGLPMGCSSRWGLELTLGEPKGGDQDRTSLVSPQ